MNEKIRQELYHLKKGKICPNYYMCIFNSEKDLCEARCHALANSLECIDKQQCSCKHSIGVNSNYMCKCNLRKFIAINIEEISMLN
jgi:hypothetical protein